MFTLVHIVRSLSIGVMFYAIVYSSIDRDVCKLFHVSTITLTETKGENRVLTVAHSVDDSLCLDYAPF